MSSGSPPPTNASLRLEIQADIHSIPFISKAKGTPDHLQLQLESLSWQIPLVLRPFPLAFGP